MSADPEGKDFPNWGPKLTPHEVVLQKFFLMINNKRMIIKKKNHLLIEYARKGATGGALMALQAGADVNHKDLV